MVPITKRDALRGAAALLPFAAGCNDVDTGGSAVTDRRQRGPENVAVDPEHRTPRAAGDTPTARAPSGATARVAGRLRR